jgi:hypothetical protein
MVVVRFRSEQVPTMTAQASGSIAFVTGANGTGGNTLVEDHGEF